MTSARRSIGGGALLGVVAVVAISAWSPAADAADVKSCLDSAEEGQKLRDSGAYRRAREQFIACAAGECPGEVRKGCVGWLGELDRLLPTVVFGAHARGQDVADVRVIVDGEVVAERIDGKPVVLDPGEHHFRFERAGEAEVDETTVILAGEKDRLVSVGFGAETPLPPLQSPPPAPTSGTQAEAREPRALGGPSPGGPSSGRATAQAVGALGLVALAAGAILDASGYVFVQQCNGDPSCTGSHERAEVEWRFVTGDVLLGGGVLAGLAAWLLWSHDSRAATHLRARINIDPSAPGATLGLTAVF